MGLLILVFVLIALLNFFFPRFGWYMQYGWMVKGDVKPSDAYLLMTRVGSILIIILLLFIWSSF